jgi:hypothetical protein
MLKEKNDPKRKDQLITIIQTLEKMHNDIVMLQEAYMKEQTALFHEKWKVRYLVRRIKAIAKHYKQPAALDAQLKQSLLTSIPTIVTQPELKNNFLNDLAAERKDPFFISFTFFS